MGPDDVDVVIAGIEDYVHENHPDLAAQVKRLENGPPVDYPIIVRISGNDFDALYSIADQVIGFLYSLPQVSNAKNSWGLQTKKLTVDVDQELARRSGVTSEDVAYSLEAGLTGIDLTQYREGDELIPVTLRNHRRGPPGLQQTGRPDGLLAKHRQQCAVETGCECRADV